MDAVALSAAEQEQAVRALAAVLLLGQIELEQGADEQAAVGAGSGPLLEHAAELLGIDAGALSHALCTRRLVTRDDEVGPLPCARLHLGIASSLLFSDPRLLLPS
jgi:myosin heavy subunit